jgi:hypothetical protein
MHESSPAVPAVFGIDEQFIWQKNDASFQMNPELHKQRFNPLFP